MITKPLHTQATEDLLATLEEDLPDLNLEEDSVMAFLNRFKIEPGPSPVTFNKLYTLYRRTSPSVIEFNNFKTVVVKYLPVSKYNQLLVNKSKIELTEEVKELLDTSTNKLVSVKSQNHFNTFLQSNNLTNGPIFCPWYELYYFYLDWLKQGNKGRLGLEPFKKFCALKFEIKYPYYRIIHYGINRESIKDYLTNEKQEEIRIWYKKWYESKSKSKRKVGVPSLRPKVKLKKSSKTD